MTFRNILSIIIIAILLTVSVSSFAEDKKSVDPIYIPDVADASKHTTEIHGYFDTN
jgi:hypothetical protein